MHNLSFPAVPRAMAPLFGRETEIQLLTDLVMDPAIRMVTITGPGGVGKTRLAQHLGLVLEPIVPDGVAFVRMSVITESTDAIPHISRAFGWNGVNPADSVEFLADAVGDSDMVIILDNLEQVIFDQEPQFDQFARLPANITWLGTSQVPLHAHGEYVFPLGPLSAPAQTDLPLEHLATIESVQLFTHKASTVNAEFALTTANAQAIAAICQELDGLPLAVELAALRTRVLPPAALHERLQQTISVLSSGSTLGDPRHRTMHTAIAWTYETLNEAERQLFLDLSLFVTGFQIDTVEFLVRYRDISQDPFDLLDTLATRGLVRVLDQFATDPRYIMLGPLRGFGTDQLNDAGRLQDAQYAQAEYMVSLTSELGTQVITSQTARANKRFRDEQRILETLMDRQLRNREIAQVLRIAVNIYRLCESVGMSENCTNWLETALAESSPSPQLKARAYNALGYLYEGRRILDLATTAHNRALEIARSIDDAHQITTALNGLGMIAHDAGRLDASKSYLEESRELAAAAGEFRNHSIALTHLATIAVYRQEWPTAEALYKDALATWERTGDMGGQSTTLGNLAVVATQQGHFRAAVRYLQRAMDIDRETHNDVGLAFGLINIAESLVYLGDLARAEDSLAEARAIVARIGITWLNDVIAVNTALIELERDDAIAAAQAVLPIIDAADATNLTRQLYEAASVLASVAQRQRLTTEAADILGVTWSLHRALESQPDDLRRREEKSIYEWLADALGPGQREQRIARVSELSMEDKLQRFQSITHAIVGPQYVPEESRHTPAALLAADYRLTAREREVLGMLCDGLSTTEMADALFVSPRTVTTHITNILNKLQVSSRAAAVGIALRDKLVV